MGEQHSAGEAIVAINATDCLTPELVVSPSNKDKCQPGLFNNKVYTGTPSRGENNYGIVVAWSSSFGMASPVKVWLYDVTSKDRLPDSGSLTLMK